MSISVFIPSYNHSKFIERTLRTIFSQTLYPAKLLIIDDGSKDESVAVIEKVLADCPFDSELIVRENRGLCKTLNEGLSKTNGEFFAYLGSDDIWYPEFLAERVKLLRSEPNAVLAYGNANLIDATDRIIDTTTDWGIYRKGDQLEMLLRGLAPISSTLAYRRNALEKTGWNESLKLEDYDLYLQLSALGEFAFDGTILSAWRKHGHNTSRDVNFMLEEVLEAQKRVGPKIGWSDKMIEEARIVTTFTYTEIFAREGDKRTALKLLSKNFHKSPNFKILGKNILRLLIPNSLIRKRRKLIVKKSINSQT